MRIRALLFMSTLAVTAMLGVGVGGASAATLFTSGAHTTRVTVGATADAVATQPIVLTSGTTPINVCNNGTLHLVLDQNNDVNGVVATVTAGSVTNCSPAPATVTFATAWRLSIPGASTTVAPNLRWAATVANVAFDLAGGLYTGTLTTGVTAVQPEATNVPLCLEVADAGELAGPLTSNGRIDTKFCFEGAATNWSLT
jgi:hypothetical protein